MQDKKTSSEAGFIWHFAAPAAGDAEFMKTSG
jgi:hypothetical protein